MFPVLVFFAHVQCAMPLQQPTVADGELRKGHQERQQNEIGRIRLVLEGYVGEELILSCCGGSRDTEASKLYKVASMTV
ncbi:hypothetical protein AKJ16_DCAP22295 [Drosera capensis]